MGSTLKEIDCQRQLTCPRYSTVRPYWNTDDKKFYWLACAWWHTKEGFRLCPKAQAYKRACESKAPHGVIEFETPQAALRHYRSWFRAAKDAESSLWEAFLEERKVNPDAEFSFDANPYMRWEP